MPGWDETELVVERHPEPLTELASSLLAQLAISARGQGSELAAQAMEEHGRLLERCQEVGVAAGRRRMERPGRAVDVRLA